MKNLGKIAGAVAFVVAVGFAGTAWADEFADGVVSFVPVTTGTAANGAPISTSADTDEPAEGGTDATGAPDVGNFNQYVALGIDEKSTATDADDDRGVIELSFTNNTCLGVNGADIRIYETGNN